MTMDYDVDVLKGHFTQIIIDIFSPTPSDHVDLLLKPFKRFLLSLKQNKD